MDFTEFTMCFNISKPSLITYTVLCSDGTLKYYNNNDVPAEILNFMSAAYIPTSCNTIRPECVNDLYMLMTFKR